MYFIFPSTTSFYFFKSPDILITNGGGLVTVEMPKQVRHDSVRHPDDDCHPELVSGSVIYSCEFTVEEIRTLIKATFEVCGPDAAMKMCIENRLSSIF